MHAQQLERAAKHWQLRPMPHYAGLIKTIGGVEVFLKIKVTTSKDNLQRTLRPFAIVTKRLPMSVLLTREKRGKAKMPNALVSGAQHSAHKVS